MGRNGGADKSWTRFTSIDKLGLFLDMVKKNHMKQFKVSATGGTFDVLHKGHMVILATSFEQSDSVIIGVCTDKMAFKKGKKLQNTYDVRLANLRD